MTDILLRAPKRPQDVDQMKNSPKKKKREIPGEETRPPLARTGNELLVWPLELAGMTKMQLPRRFPRPQA